MELLPEEDRNETVPSEFQSLSFSEQDAKNQQNYKVPNFISKLSRILSSPYKQPICVVVPEGPNLVNYLTIIEATRWIKLKFPEMLATYKSQSLAKGQRVIILPDERVYFYEGPLAEAPDRLVKLSFVNQAGFRTFPASRLAQLKPTNRKIPIGENEKFPSIVLSPFDRLVGIRSGENEAIFSNRFIIHSSYASFTNFLEKHYVTVEEVNYKLKDIFPWGFVDQGGKLRPRDHYQAAGEPLVAAGRFLEGISIACSSSEKYSRAIISANIKNILKEAKAFDSIAISQKLLVLSNANDEQSINALEKWGAKIWELDKTDLGDMEEYVKSYDGMGSLPNLTKKIQNKFRISIKNEVFRSDVFGHASKSIFNLLRIIQKREPNDDFDRHVFALLASFFELNETMTAGNQETLTNVMNATNELTGYLKKYAFKISPEETEAVNKAITALLDLSTSASPELGKKIERLKAICAENAQKNIGVFCRSTRISEILNREIDILKLNARAYPISGIPDDINVDISVLVGWPNRAKFERFVNSPPTEEVLLVLYEFEFPWFEAFKKSSRQRGTRWYLSREEKSKVLDLDEGAVSADDTALLQEANTNILPEVSTSQEDENSFLRFEERVNAALPKQVVHISADEEIIEARQVKFVGNKYAWFTEGYSMHAINGVSARDKDNFSSRKTINEIKAGDYLLFRDTGDSEVLRLFAEDMYGQDEYVRQWAIATKWKATLRSLGKTSGAVARRLREFGLDRNYVTIMQWMYYPDRIAPQDKEDIEAIARAAGDSALLAQVDEVMGAAKKIRGAHLKAGARLSRFLIEDVRKKLQTISDEPTKIEMTFGSFWVVCVEAISEDAQSIPYRFANRLIDSDFQFSIVEAGQTSESGEKAKIAMTLEELLS